MIVPADAVVDREEFNKLKEDGLPILKLLSTDANNTEINDTCCLLDKNGRYKQVPTRYREYSRITLRFLTQLYGRSAVEGRILLPFIAPLDYVFKLGDRWLLRCKEWLDCIRCKDGLDSTAIYTKMQLLDCLRDVVQINDLSRLIVSYMDFVEAIDVLTAGELLYQLITLFRTNQFATSQDVVGVFLLYESFVSRYEGTYSQLSTALRWTTNGFSVEASSISIVGVSSLE